MRKKSAVLLCSMVLMVLMASVGAASDWPQFQKDEKNIGYTNDAAPLGVNFAWRAPTPSAVDVVTVVGGNSVFVLSKGNNVTSINKTTGAQNWVDTSLNTGVNAISTPAYDEYNNTLYVATAGNNSNAKLHAISTTTGDVIWEVNVKRHDGSNEIGQPNTPVLFYNYGTPENLTDDVVMFGTWVNSSTAGTYYCYEAATGDPIWNRTSNNNRGYYWAGAALIGDYLVYGEDSGYLTSVEWKNVVNWDVQTADEIDTGTGPIRSSIAWKATNETYGHLFFTSTGSHLTKIGFDTSTGDFNRLDWSNVSIPYSTSTPVIYDGNVYVGTGSTYLAGSKQLLCVAESDISQQNWAHPSNGAVQASPAISIQNGDKYVYFTTNCKNGSFYCVKDANITQWIVPTLETGKTIIVDEWEVWLGSQLQGVSISDNWVYGGNDGGYTYGLSNVTPAAYGYEVDDSPSCNDPTEEFSPADYAKIRVDDNEFAVSETDEEDYYAAHRFNFSIETPVANVTAINVTWVGIGDHDNSIKGANLSIYNFNSGAYDLLQSGPTNNDEVTLTGERTADIDNYINSGNVVVLAKQKSPQSSRRYASIIETDYVKVIITTI